MIYLPNKILLAFSSSSPSPSSVSLSVTLLFCPVGWMRWQSLHLSFPLCWLLSFTFSDSPSLRFLFHLVVLASSLSPPLMHLTPLNSSQQPSLSHGTIHKCTANTSNTSKGTIGSFSVSLFIPLYHWIGCSWQGVKDFFLWVYFSSPLFLPHLAVSSILSLTG